MRLVASARTLDLDHIGAQIAEEHSAIGASESFSQFDNANAIENAVHSGEYNQQLLCVRWLGDVASS